AGGSPGARSRMADLAKQLPEAVATLRELLEPGDHVLGRALVPPLERRVQKRLAIGEVPVEAPLGHPKLLCERLYGYPRHPKLGDRLEGRALPGLRVESGGTFCCCGRHRFSLFHTAAY